MGRSTFGTQAIADEREDRRTWDVEVQLAVPAPPDTLTQVVRTVAGVAGVDPWNRTSRRPGPPSVRR
ncbi:hypothetical protein WEH80_05710 [Actinomycetes bacterium KLBMP 9759]